MDYVVWVVLSIGCYMWYFGDVEEFGFGGIRVDCGGVYFGVIGFSL